jgi:hypothetical protein
VRRFRNQQFKWVALNCTSHPLFSIVPAFNKAEPYPVEVDNGIAVIWLIFGCCSMIRQNQGVSLKDISNP